MTRLDAFHGNRKQPSKQKRVAIALDEAIHQMEARMFEDAAERLRQIPKGYRKSVAYQLAKAKLLHLTEHYDDALAITRKLFEVYPECTEVRQALFASLRDLRHHEELLEAIVTTDDYDRSDDEWLIIYRFMLDICCWERTEAMLPRLLQSYRDDKLSLAVYGTPLMDLCANPRVDTATLAQLHRNWGEKVLRDKYQMAGGAATVAPGERIRIGFLSSDFRIHPVYLFLDPILHLLDRKRFEVFCYANVLVDDQFTEIARQKADRFVDVSGADYESVARAIHRDGVHILIDLGGHTQNSLLGVMAYRPAPVQITFLGYPNTTGLSTVDFRITDRAGDPDPELYTEELLYMEPSFLCYCADFGELQPSEVTPCLRDGRPVTFGCCNHYRKLNPECVEVWSRILAACPDSRLLLRSLGYEGALVRKHILAEFRKHGIDGERIVFRGGFLSVAEHLSVYNEIDIALDPFPYHGTTTTCDTLKMGVPLITLEGDRHCQRVSSSIMRTIGFTETIAASKEEYVAKAVGFAQNPNGLSMLRGILPVLFQHSRLNDPQTYVAGFAQVLEEAWEKKTAVR